MSNQFKFFHGFLFLLLLTVACSAVGEVKNTGTPFFDLKAYFTNESTAYQNVKAYRKTIQLDEKREEQELDSLDLAVELALFVNSDINKPAWLDRYTTDSVFDTNGLLERIQYRAIEDDLRTRSLLISFSNSGQVDSVFVRNASSSMVAQSEELLTYIPQQGYRIENRQKVTSQSEHALIVDVKFVY